MFRVAERPHGRRAKRSSTGGIAADDDVAAYDDITAVHHDSIDRFAVDLAIGFSAEPVGRNHQIAAQAG
ncbi:MAG TPA: hypothetical protein VFR64_12395 [Methylomirabilota bacterium]|nr:hypothetical protein [Methylomirabilota bacterium]